MARPKDTFEQLKNYESRTIFDGTRPQDIKKKLEEVIMKPEEYHFDLKAGRKFVEDNFLWQRMADHFEIKVIERVK